MSIWELAPRLYLVKLGTHNFERISDDGIRHVYHQVSSSVTLYAGNEITVIDSGARFYREEIKALVSELIDPMQVDVFIATHYHHDHIDNSDLFPKADRILDYGRVTPDGVMTTYLDADSIKHPDDVEIFATPGHVKNHISVKIVVNDVSYVCAGDAVREDVLNVEFRPDYVNEEYIASARRVFEEADIIIPGHGDVIDVDMNNLPPLIH